MEKNQTQTSTSMRFNFWQADEKLSDGTDLILCSVVWKSKSSAALHKPEYTENENTPSSLDHAGRSNAKGKDSSAALVFKYKHRCD